MAPAAEARRPARAALALALALLVALALLGGPSCTTVLGLDPYQNAQAGLCDKIAGCYASGAPECRDRLAARLTGDQVSAWLTSFSADTCLGSCADARRCLDIPPMCSGQSQSCQQIEECCGFSSGDADCFGGRCCVPRGVHCATDEDCCGNAGFCNPAPGDTTPDPMKYCGDFICLEQGKTCQIGEQCCTGLCKQGQCSDTLCYEDGFDCQDAADCCSAHCDATGLCGNACSPEMGPCKADSDCCNQHCVMPAGAVGGACITPTCQLDDVDCAADAECCSLFCDPTFFKCSHQCVAPGGGCMADQECCGGACSQGSCGCSDAYCTMDAQCCSGHCLHGTCAPECAADPPCDHTSCTQGGPLGTACDPCTTAVCAADSYCCCVAWDALCVSRAISTTSCKGCP